MPFKYTSHLHRLSDPIIIQAYGGYANAEHIFSHARVLEDEGIEFNEEDGILRNIWNSYKRFESDEIAAAPVIADWGESAVEILSDREGYVSLRAAHGLAAVKNKSEWLPLDFRLGPAFPQAFSVTTSILRPGKGVDYGIISDVDDTVIHTGVASTFKWRLLVNSITANAQKRRPLLGAAEFYHALHQGVSAQNSNPIFYVSNSPWNIHEYLTTFLTHHRFPQGPLILRDIGRKGSKEKGGKTIKDSQKYRSIVQIIEAYPEMKFVLIGDAAEVDTDIYISLARDYPQRIKCIYIRAVSKEKHMRRVKALIESQTHVEVKLLKDSEEGMSHARALGLIR